MCMQHKSSGWRLWTSEFEQSSYGLYQNTENCAVDSIKVSASASRSENHRTAIDVAVSDLPSAKRLEGETEASLKALCF